MTCWANRHTFSWGSSTATDAMPLSLRCDCGAMSRKDIDPVKRLQDALEAAAQRETELRAALGKANDRAVKSLEWASKRNSAQEAWELLSVYVMEIRDLTRAALAQPEPRAAKGDGITDDTAAAQAYFDLVARARGARREPAPDHLWSMSLPPGASVYKNCCEQAQSAHAGVSWEMYQRSGSPDDGE